jgi:PAS domain S-box-containing protein
VQDDTKPELLEINHRLFDLFVVHLKTGNAAQQCTKEQLWEIKRGMEEIRGMLLEYVPVEKRRSPLALLNEYLNVLDRATLPLIFGREELFYPRMLYSSIFEAANEAERQDAPAWILDHMVGTHIIYDETGYILHASSSIGGYTKEEIAGRHFTYFVIPDQIPIAFQNFGNLFKGKHGTHALLMKYKSGEIDWITLNCHPYNKGDKLMVLSALKEGRFEGSHEEYP